MTENDVKELPELPKTPLDRFLVSGIQSKINAAIDQLPIDAKGGVYITADNEGGAITLATRLFDGSWKLAVALELPHYKSVDFEISLVKHW